MSDFAGSDFWLGPALVQLERYYWAPGGPAEKTRADMRAFAAGKWKRALGIFFEHYAFERGGAPSNWGRIARKAVEDYPDSGDLGALPAHAWNQFTSQVSAPNEKSNPLAISYPRLPATRFISTLLEDDHNIIRWAVRRMSSGDAVASHKDLQAITGIGPKIASLFLRDVVTSHQVSEARLDDRRAIMPVDVWVRRAVESIAHEPDLVNEDDVQNAALEIADRLGIGIATLDTGLWVLGARFARSKLKLKQLLADPSAFEAFVRDQRVQTEAAAFALKAVAQAMVDRRGGRIS